MDFLLWDDSLLKWGLGLDNFLWGFFFFTGLRRFLFFSFLGSVLGFEGLDGLLLDLGGFFVHGGLGGFSGFGFGDGGLIFLAGLLRLGFLFVLFFGIDLFFFGDDQGEWAG